MINDCLTAFKNKDYNAAVRLLPLLVEQAKKESQLQRRPLKTVLSRYTISIGSIDPWSYRYLEAGLLHLSSRNGWWDITRILIEKYQLDPLEGDNKGNTCLHYAAAGNQLKIVKYLVSRMQHVNHEVAKQTLCCIAAANGSLDVIKYFIEHQNWNAKNTDYNGRTVLHYAAKHIDTVKYLVTECNCDPMVTDKDGKTVLHYAVEQNQLDVVEYLLSFKDAKGNTFLHLAAIAGLIVLVKWSIGHKCDPNATNRSCQTVLHCAVEHIDTVKYLITECNCDPMVTDKDGKTVLHYAVQNKCLAVVEYLVSTGKCDQILAANKYGNTVLSFAIEEKSLNIIQHLAHHPKAKKLHILHQAVKQIDIVKYLITEHKCDPMVTDKDGKTVLHYAAKHIDTVKYLINEYKCDPMVTDKDGKTVFHYAVEQNQLDVVEYLLSFKDAKGNTFFHLAAIAGSIVLVKWLIGDHNCDPNATNRSCQTVLHCAVKHINVVKYLITECNCDPMVTDKDGKIVLHYAAEQKCLDVVEYLLSTGKCNPVSKDNKGRTPLQLTDDNNQKFRSLFKKFGQVKTSHPVDSYANVLLLGNPGAGKSTLSKVINDTVTGAIAFGSFRNVKGVKPCTAGIIPYKLQHKTLGNIILHDFAGHSEYYSSHSAVIENLLQGSAGVFLIVVNILDKEAIKQLHQWLTVVRNEAQKALDQCHVIVVVSHVDEISDPVERRKREEEIQKIIGRERCDSAFLDCRKLGGSGVDSLFNKLSSACESIRSTSGRNLSLYCHMMYGLLEERKENILTLSDVMTAAKDNDSYVLPDKREEVLDVLHSLDSIGLIKVLKSKDKVWVVVNKGILLSELDGILFAPETFKEHVDIASNTGIVSVSGLTRLFPDYDPDMLICFLKNMELCQEMNPTFLRMTNLHQLTVGKTEKRGERLLFFPCLSHSDRPDEMTSQVYQFGWCLQCTGKHHFFPPRYFHVLSLHLAYKLALPQDETLNRHCTFWRNGLYWFNGHGVGVLVEIVDNNQCVLVLMSCEEGYNIVELRREVIGEVMSVYKESCPSLEVKELVIDPKELDYPVNTPRERAVYSVKDVMSAIDEGRPFTVSDNGIKQREVQSILPDESLEDISKLSLLGGRDIKVRINA